MICLVSKTLPHISLTALVQANIGYVCQRRYCFYSNHFLQLQYFHVIIKLNSETIDMTVPSDTLAHKSEINYESFDRKINAPTNKVTVKLSAQYSKCVSSQSHPTGLPSLALPPWQGVRKLKTKSAEPRIIHHFCFSNMHLPLYNYASYLPLCIFYRQRYTCVMLIINHEQHFQQDFQGL